MNSFLWSRPQIQSEGGWLLPHRPASIASVSTHCLEGWYCRLKFTAGKVTDTFSHPAAYIASGTIREELSNLITAWFHTHCNRCVVTSARGSYQLLWGVSWKNGKSLYCFRHLRRLTPSTEVFIWKLWLWKSFA